MPDSVTASDEYTLRFSGDVGVFLLGVQSNAVSNLLRAQPALPNGARLLDHAGTHGQLAATIDGLGYNRTVSASSAEVVDRANAASPKLVGPLNSLPVDGMAFDAVVCVRLLAHIGDIEAAIREMCRLARYTVVVDYPSLRSVNVFSRWLFKYKKRIERDTREYVSISDKRLHRVFSECGFRPVKEVRQFFIPMALHRAVGDNIVLRGLEKLAKVIGLTGLIGNPVTVRFDRIETE